MIKNERQYRITRAQAARFTQALRQFEGESSELEGLHPLLVKARKDALRSQLADLVHDLREYDALKEGSFDFDQLKTVAEIPKLLIRARIARGLSQRELADRLGLKEQQIQRYEATDYSSASLARMTNVVTALGVSVDHPMFAGDSVVPLSDLLKRLAEIGLPIEVANKRLVPRKRLPPTMRSEKNDTKLVHAVAETIERVFQLSPHQLVSTDVPDMKPALSSVRFKVAANAHPERVTAYAIYAHYLALLVMNACSHIPTKALPNEPTEARREIEANYGSISLSTIVNYVWDLGIPVLPLDDPGAFHGACFRDNGHNVIVLKQKTSSESRWAFDLLHELWHAGQEPDLPERTVLEPDDSETGRTSGDEERTASRFAAAVLLDGRGQQLAELCLAAANNDLRRLKKGVQDVASREGVAVDSLANYMAFRLSVEQGQNWWSTANTLQPIGTPWTTVRNVFFERADFTKLSEPDAELLSQALISWEDAHYG